MESEKRGMSFEELLAIPEKDDWEYSDGFSTTCVAFILQMYKEAGLFGSLSDSIQVTEFTVCSLPCLLHFPSFLSTGITPEVLCEFQKSLPGTSFSWLLYSQVVWIQSILLSLCRFVGASIPGRDYTSIRP